ncbi:hypothetical protein [Burkholderia gladioli]|uniref:hypothetical protein n=1 Tax=Burkholderia gladioli TaxID=28095 RepID=UPI0011B24276|nr:hypothetical protein [Burkholderia gladioli]
MGQPFFVRHICSSSRDPRFLQYDLAEQKARQDLKQAIAAHDTHRAQVLQAGIDDITKKRNALDIAQRPQAQRQLQEQRQRFIETMQTRRPCRTWMRVRMHVRERRCKAGTIERKSSDAPWSSNSSMTWCGGNMGSPVRS